ncbi:MAG: AMP-binding protein, partial [Oscillochloris sp.]|nr:AMP-binding protein [Oscillochloris sp.]
QRGAAEQVVSGLGLGDIQSLSALDCTALRASLAQIVNRHEILRASFAYVDGRPHQVIAPPVAPDSFPLPLVDLSDLPEAERAQESYRLAYEEARRPFDLACGPLLRVQLIRLSEQEHVALLTMHHITFDGWSMGVFVEELADLYAEATGGSPATLPELSVQYADFASWQRGWLQGEALSRQLDYWTAQLADVPALLDLPTDRPRPAIQSFAGTTSSFALPAELAHALKALAQEENSTLFITLLAGFQAVLSRYSGQQRFAIGTPIANRTRAELEPLIGFFANTLALTADLRSAPSFRELLRRVREIALGAYAHQDLPFETLVEAVQPERSLAHAPIFQVMFVMDNQPLVARQLPGLTITSLNVDSGASSFDMTLSMSEDAGTLRGSLEYNTDLFDATTIQRLVGHFTTLLMAAVADPDQPVGQLPLLTATERELVLHTWNQTNTAFPSQVCIHEQIARWAREQPNHPALRSGGTSVTYAEFDTRANQLAHALRRHGVGPDTLVAIALPRTPELIIAILATLKAGGAFLPLDLAYPIERLRFMLEDAQPTVLITMPEVGERLLSGAATPLVPDHSSLATTHQAAITGHRPPVPILLDPADPALSRELV